jgi:hypothetical protein
MASLIKRVRRDAFIWAAILAGHGLLLVVVLRIESQTQRAKPDAAVAMSFIWLSLSSPLIHRVTERQPVALVPKPLRLEAQPQSSPEVQSAPPPETTPRVDWSREGAIAAAAISKAEATAASKPSTFSTPPNEMRKPCQPKESSMKWKPPRVGMAGTEGGLHLPYVAIGKRCVIGLGFFGCALGELPQVNGHLLDDMYDPNRSHTSVSAIDTCE